MRRLLIITLFFVTCLGAHAGRHQIQAKVTKIYKYELNENAVTLICDIHVDRPLESTAIASEKVECFKGDFQNMITKNEKVKVTVFNGASKLPTIKKLETMEIPDEGYECLIYIMGDNDTITFKNGTLVELGFYARRAD